MIVASIIMPNFISITAIIFIIIKQENNECLVCVEHFVSPKSAGQTWTLYYLPQVCSAELLY